MDINPIQYIAKFQARAIPYAVDILGINIIIEKHDVYPSGKLAEFFLSVLLDKVGVKDKNIADIGAGCSTLGIVMAKGGAGQVVGVDISPASVDCSIYNIDKHGCGDKVQILKGGGIEPLKNYRNYFDFIVSGIPRSSTIKSDFDKLSEEDKSIHPSFFDVDDKLIISLLRDAWPLLKKNGHVFITACLAIMDRMKSLFKRYNVEYTIIASNDIHNDGNDHYILKLTQIRNSHDEL